MTGETAREKIIDAHLHILPPERTAGLVRWVKKIFNNHPSTEEYPPELIMSELRECGVTAAFNFVYPLREDETKGLNRFNAELGDQYKFIIPFGSFHPGNHDREEIVDECLTKSELAGIKVHPHVQDFEIFSSEFRGVFERLDYLQRPLVAHTGFDYFYGKTQDVEYLRLVLDRYPGMPVVLVHSLIPRFDVAYRLTAEYPQLYLDFTNVVSAVRWSIEPPLWLGAESFEIPGLKENISYFYQLVERFSDRIMFGTDHPAGMGSPAQIFADFESFGFDEKAGRDMLYGTAAGFIRKHCPAKYFKSVE